MTQLRLVLLRVEVRARELWGLKKERGENKPGVERVLVCSSPESRATSCRDRTRPQDAESDEAQSVKRRASESCGRKEESKKGDEREKEKRVELERLLRPESIASLSWRGEAPKE